MMIPEIGHRPLRRGEQGASLVVVMIVLLVVTVIGIASARLALLGEMSARHDRDTQIAFEAAEAALVDAQDDIENKVASSGSCTALRGQKVFDSVPSLDGGACYSDSARRGVCTPAAPGTRPKWASVDFLDDSTTAPTVAVGTYTCRAFDAGSAGVKPARPPRYVIESLLDTTQGGVATIKPGQAPPQPTFRITAMGFGPRLDTRVVLQAEYRKSKAP